MLADWLKHTKKITYREASALTGLSTAAIHHVASGKRQANRETAKALEKLELPRSVKIWVAKQTASWLDKEREWWSNWAQHDLTDEFCDD